MNPWLTVVLIVLATYSATRFVVADAFPPMASARDWVLGKLGDEHWFSYLITCPWCASVYVSAGVVLVTDHYASVPLPWLVWLAARAVAGYLAVYEPEE